MVRPVVSDVAGLEFTTEEWDLFREFKPFGFILFKRNCDNPEQLKRLTDQMRDVTGDENIPILIDQEGGRVARLGPPNWRKYPSAAVYAELYDQNKNDAISAVSIHASLMANDLLECGINVDCYPVLDILFDGADKVIGDRSFGRTTDKIIELSRAGAEAMMEMGVTPIIKHIPGHGRADVDSHLSLPIVDTDIDTLRETDFVPFKALNEMPCAMTAHVIYSDIDPDYCGTISKKIISDVIRDEIGFKGVLCSDDLSMKALNKSAAENAVDALNAGCDIALHCNGTLDERRDTLMATEELNDNEYQRLRTYFVKSENMKSFDANEQYAQLLDLTKGLFNV
ncbi:beta-N-acetylhexosaminidase [Pseudemcibacter aquimaris]|uniref:beta-N-acetylhexosaminidase n=1 Tax=Pseudemcibacter aquimaris TaxID=2857064 RepID=UPI002013233B|nr:beta-N-acetylhexosaminidase [Pseudemcibacter aquimaris]MCC3860531.1 beta-N-acetylhexosaminidase [Pseudemcibacter aquimaris]WDU59356.1 beta-N-acetylhexosaminidase [Pseudemcibacter aquimaris]